VAFAPEFPHCVFFVIEGIVPQSKGVIARRVGPASLNFRTTFRAGFGTFWHISAAIRTRFQVSYRGPEQNAPKLT
jgi:tRNA(Ile2) C34 agmatinyltransferase TiaS